MVRADVCELIAESPEAHGVFDAPTRTKRKVFCEVKSVGQQEAYQARATGLNPEYKLKLSHSFEYRGEKLVSFRGITFAILRTWTDEKDGIELTIQRTEGNADVQPTGSSAESTE